MQTLSITNHFYHTEIRNMGVSRLIKKHIAKDRKKNYLRKRNSVSHDVGEKH